ncbi:anion permease [Halobacteria archaeon AArc-curdl1]|uniref:Phosphate transporter n=1 Tax=Natronosalvus hydrolyticus TaxID=2979988 RepID=A0AAP2Z7C1_9EURY|nr:anion permease [Halobacteria archaeon AArc-curdl1]
MVEALLIGGVLIACFVAYNIGGATTGPAFGPAVGADVISKTAAGLLMSICFFLGAATIGRRVVDTLGEDLVHDPGVFTLSASIIILFFIGGALLVGNLSGAPSSTSMTAVGSIAGFALAADVLNFAVIGEILAWWLISPVIGFWAAVMVGRYLYTSLDRIISIDQSDGPLLTLDRSNRVPRPALGPNTTQREVVGAAVVVGIGCLMAFSSGASNIANAIAPLVGSDALEMNLGIVIGSLAVAVGALTIARRTMETLGNDITDLPLTAAIIVAVLSSIIVILLSAIGIPASFVIIATVCIVGLGWGRSTRRVSISDAVRGEATQRISINSLTADEGAPTVGNPELADSSSETTLGDRSSNASESPSPGDLFDPETTVRVILMQNVVPILATIGSYLTFTLLGPV